VPKQPLGRVSDYAHALTDAQRAQLEQQLLGYESGTRQIAVAIWRSIENESVEDFSNRVLIKWGLGGKKTDDGVLLAVFLDEHKIRIENGYGVEDKLTDARDAQIIREIIAPHFKLNDVFTGLSKGVEAINDVVSGHEPKLPVHRENPSNVPWGLLLFIGFLIFMMYLNRRGFSGGPWWWGGGGGGWTGGGGGWSGGGGGGWGGGGRDRRGGGNAPFCFQQLRQIGGFQHGQAGQLLSQFF
jgi:uncharacterized protein